MMVLVSWIVVMLMLAVGSWQPQVQCSSLVMMPVLLGGHARGHGHALVPALMVVAVMMMLVVRLVRDLLRTPQRGRGCLPW